MSEAVLVLKSGRCEWGKCLFCGYGRIQGDNPSSGVFQKKIDDFIQNLDINVKQIKVFGSGSFFDEKQVSATNRN
ncbi:MAG: hypothetical protein B6U97_02805 [Candidatus Altiarchaeales archaeon ex4484_96]|nr:MAG: hypothetical protein B6U97_02805 [Candidatus Altiarchaeales archaeon ex4484_96]